MSGVLTARLRLEHSRDVADLGRHPGRGDDELARPAGDRGVHVHHVGPVAQRHVGFPDRGRAFRDRQALPGQLGLGDLQRRRLQQPAVSRNDVTRRYRDDIAGDQLSGRDLRLLAVAPYPGRDDHHLLERGDGGLGLAFLLQAKNRVAQRQQDQQDAGSQLPEGKEAEDPGREQDDLHGVGVLPDERVPARFCPARGQLVGPEPGGPRRRFRCAKAALRVYLYGPQNALHAERVPRKPAGLRLRFRPGRIGQPGRHGSLPSRRAAISASWHRNPDDAPW